MSRDFNMYMLKRFAGQQRVNNNNLTTGGIIS